MNHFFKFLMFINSFLALEICQSSQVLELQPNVSKIERCKQLAETYNRCENHMSFSAQQNLFTFPSLKKTSLCDDGKNLTILDRINNPDISSMLMLDYAIGTMTLPETRNEYSPGSIRNEDFLKAVYGANEDLVTQNLVKISFLGQKVLFNKKNGAAYQFSLVSQDLLELYKNNVDPQLTAYLKPFINGPVTPGDRYDLRNFTYEWRYVAGTKRLSNHSFGVAIDLQPIKDPQYWLWDVNALIKSGQAIFKPGTDMSHATAYDVSNFVPVANNKYPLKLVEVFEKHGFIWGGKWFRYDIMHFEYRPEFFPHLKLDCAAVKN